MFREGRLVEMPDMEQGREFASKVEIEIIG
jgi:hypothetical protein